MIKQNYEVVVIGGGIIGCSIAYHLAKENVDVAIIERNQIGQETTSAAAGMLGAHSESDGEFSRFFSFARESQQAYIDLNKELYQLSGIDIGYRKGGILKLAFSEEDKANLTQLIKQPTVDWLNEHQVREIEPKIASNLIGAAYIPDDVSTLPKQTCEAFAKSIQVLGGSIIEHTHVHGIEKHRENHLVKTINGEVEAKYVVLSTGVLGNHLFKSIGLNEKLSPVKGENLIVSSKIPLLKHTLFHAGSYMVPRNNGEIVIGATMVKNDWSKTVSLQGLNFLIEKAKTIVPKAINLKIEGFTAGLRPTTFDGKPFIGVHPADESIFIATGHYRNGILLAPATGKMIADLILERKIDDELIELFRLDRHRHQITT